MNMHIVQYPYIHILFRVFYFTFEIPKINFFFDFFMPQNCPFHQIAINKDEIKNFFRYPETLEKYDMYKFKCSNPKI